MNCYSTILSKKIGLYNAVVFQELKRAYSFEINFSNANMINDIYTIDNNQYVELYITSDMLGITEKQYRKALDNLELMGYIDTYNVFSINKRIELFRIKKVRQ